MNTLVKLHGQTAENQGGIAMLKTNVNDFWTITKPENPRTAAEAESYINSVDNWNIDNIENLQEIDCILLAVDHEKIKEHDVYFVDFKGYFGYSAIVFYDGAMIRHTNLYELHYRHSFTNREELHKYYIKLLNSRLYTDAELLQPLKNYTDYQNKTKYIRDYYSCRENYISAFQILTREEEKTAYKEATKNLHYNPVTFGYYESIDFCKKCVNLLMEIENQRKAMNDNLQYWKQAFYSEFFNYECQIGGRYEEAAEATGITEFNEVQKQAFKEAKKEFLDYCYKHDCY